MKKAILFGTAFACALAWAAPAFAQEIPGQQTAPPSATAPARPAPAAVTPESAAPQIPAKPAPQMRTELIKLMYLDTGTAITLLNAYTTTRKISPTRSEEGIIVVTDTPEIVAKMLQVIKEYDVKPTELQFTVQIVEGGDMDSDEALRNDPLIRDLRNVLKYKGFTLLDGTVMRVIDNERAEAKVGPEGKYGIQLRPKYIKDGAQESIQVEIELYKPIWITQTTNNVASQQRFNNSLIKTTLMLKAGEKTVVGVSKSDGDKGLILILSGKPSK
jgi:hypothetical protein